MSVKYGSKQYYREKVDEKERDIREYQNIQSKLNDAFCFVFQKDKHPYRVETDYRNPYYTMFRYVTEDGTLHSVKRTCNHASIEVLNYDRDTAIILDKSIKNSPVYYILLKKEEIFCELPNDYLCPLKIKLT